MIQTTLIKNYTSLLMPISANKMIRKKRIVKMK
jgi:hypothetical protein